MPVQATLTSYLPILLVSVNNPDDSAFETQPDGQVDYLSHEWREEDVWRSWRSMTRQKNAIANGMRLENASWRTWWKQRNKLKTISPETLNWLKDSDVTWLYGPLHIGSDWQHTADHEPLSPCQPRIDNPDSASGSRAATPSGKKPILKHRSITELLSLPTSPFFHLDSDEEDIEDPAHLSDDPEHHQRPPLMHTKSDTHISWRSRPFRKDSPPRIIASDLPPSGTDHLTTSTASSESSNSTGSDQDLNAQSSAGAEGPGGKKKHISFNTFVEQCIAIEKPKPKRKASSVQFFHDSTYDDGYDEDSEVDDDEDADEPSSFFLNNSAGLDSDTEDEDEDEVLEMRSKRSRSSSSSRSRQSAFRTTSPPSALHNRRPSIIRQSSTDRDRVTIAPIAPTILKTTGVGNHLVHIGEGRSMPSAKEVELVYVPPSNSIYSLPGTPNLGHEHEDVYHHRESYFSIGTEPSAPSATSHSRSAGSSPVLGTVGLPRVPSRQISHSQDLSQFFVQQPFFDSPIPTEQVREEDAYDYFGGPDLGEDYPERRLPASQPRRNISDQNDDDRGAGGVLRYGQGGAATVPTGRHSGSWSSPVSSSPRIVVNEVAGATEEREELSTGSSRSRSPSESAHDLLIPRKASDAKNEPDIPLAVSLIHNGPTIPVPVPRIVTHSSSAPSSPPDSAFLSPTEAALSSRGRSSQCSPVSMSTTTGSYSRSSDSRSGSRGRSSTRNSSFSDHERSGSRSSRGTSSPIGSISPTGSAIGIGGVYIQGRGRDRDSGSTGVKMYRRGSSDDERGRDRNGRRIGDSLSPPSIMGSPSRNPSDDYPAYSPILERAVQPSPSSSVCGSSISGSSTASAATIMGPVNDDDNIRRKIMGVPSRPLHIPIPSPIPEEEEQRSRQPTPANSPVRAFTSPASPSASSPQERQPPGSPLHVTPPPKSRPSAPVTSPSEAQAIPNSPVRGHERRISSDGQEQHGTLVGRAADIVSSARGFLGAIWNAV
ncbi:hypothetical protein PHLCEN_2v7466 [Hermanssonia centrifuga]|uniref:Nitrogen regulatory protein areA GATA-like domain-containing protein n=1 Tax=Hermanssonia centrifuga TaxID=98765 RepID=A0A2R6NWG0_9APHY|nr:hypothetical protein PHLCEN_2v7466 [Hermanssonia centrifuga]